MSRRAHIDSVNLTIAELDKVGVALTQAAESSDTLMDLMEASVGDSTGPGGDARDVATGIRNDITALLGALNSVRIDLTDYLTHI